MSNRMYWPTREIMLAMLETIQDYNDSNIPISKTEIVKGMYSSNYAYVLGILNSMLVFAYIAENDGVLRITYTGRDFIVGVPF